MSDREAIYVVMLDTFSRHLGGPAYADRATDVAERLIEAARDQERTRIKAAIEALPILGTQSTSTPHPQSVFLVNLDAVRAAIEKIRDPDE